MPEYEFAGCDNPKCPDKKRGRKFIEVTNYYVIRYQMGTAPKVGESIACPTCAAGQIVRIFSLPQVSVKQALPDFQNGQSYMAKIAGQDTKVTFVDHPHTSSEYQKNLADKARQAGVSSFSNSRNMRYSEKHGQMVVDVVSSVPDPLGRMKRSDEAKRAADLGAERIDVKQPVKVRKSKPSSCPISKAEPGKYRIPLRKT
jgi:hypothetical protein